MSRQRKAIERAAKECDLVIQSLEWEPIGIALEMCGPSGGWSVYTDRQHFCAYNAREICEQMRNWKKYDLALPDSHFAGCEQVELDHYAEWARKRDEAEAA